MSHSTTSPIQDIINRRVEIGMADLLLAMYDAGYCAGAGVPSELPIHPGMADLRMLIEARHQAEVLALRRWADPPLRSDDVPGWLLSQQQQCDPVRAQAAAERWAALGDSQPPRVLP